jgi:hypothetical protein
VERASYLFRAVEVPPGDHLVEWRYQPASLFVGGAISAGALLVAGLLTVRGIGLGRTETSAARPRSAPPAAAPAGGWI